jgi:hypothetical protein
MLNRNTGWFELSPKALEAKLLRLNRLYGVEMPRDKSLGQKPCHEPISKPSAIPEANSKPEIKVTVKKRRKMEFI